MSDHCLPVDHPDELELLGVRRADGNDHAAGVAELGEQGERQSGSSGGDQDRIEGSEGGKTEGAISGKKLNIGVAERGQDFASALGKGWEAFD